MEIKKFSLYSEEEREQLLMHWWHYYGKMIVSLAEVEQFNKLVKKDSMLMKNVALIAFLCKESSQTLIRTMRVGNTDEYLDLIKRMTDEEYFKSIEGEVEKAFLKEVVGTYNNPEPDIPMTEEQIVEGLEDLVDTGVDGFTIVEVKKNSEEDDEVLTAKKVRDVYTNCLLKDDEVKDDAPTVDFILGEGVRSVSVFSAERLGQNKEIVTEMIEELPEIEMGVSFLNMCVDKNGRQWADTHPTMDLLVQLGNATGAIRFLLPRDCWERFPGGMPYIIRDNEKDNKKVVGNKPKEYKKVLEDFEMKYMG